MFLDRFGKDADMIARIQTGNDDAITFFINESGGETLIASAAGTFEGIESDGVNRLDTFAQTLLDAEEVFFHIGTEILQIVEIVRNMSQGITDIMRVDGDEETAHLHIHPNDQSQKNQSGDREDDEAKEKRIVEK